MNYFVITGLSESHLLSLRQLLQIIPNFIQLIKIYNVIGIEANSIKEGAAGHQIDIYGAPDFNELWEIVAELLMTGWFTSKRTS